MKKLILLLIISLAGFTNSFAQNRYIHKDALPAPQHTPNLNVPEGILKNNTNEATMHIEGGSVIPVYDSIYHWPWDYDKHGWLDQSYSKKINFIYDNHYNMISSIQQYWDYYDSIWYNIGKGINTFDATNKVVYSLYQKWDGSAWVNSSIDTITYDANNNLISSFSLSWDTSASNWVNSALTNNIFDTKNNLMRSIDLQWVNSVWVNYLKDTISYDANNNLINDLAQSWDGSAWVNFYKDSNIYDANNKPIISFQLDWKHSVWVNFYKYSYTYDSYNNVASDLLERWDGSSWQKYIEWTYTYDANNIQKSIAERDYSNSYVTGGDSTYFYFHTVTGIIEPTKKNESILIYPNPAREELTIRNREGTELNIEKYILYNVPGEIIKTETVKPARELNINIKALPPAVYFLELKTEKGTVMKRLVKE